VRSRLWPDWPAPARAGISTRLFGGIRVVLVLVAGAVVALYGLLLRRVNYEKFKDLLVYCQVAFLSFFSSVTRSSRGLRAASKPPTHQPGRIAGRWSSFGMVWQLGGSWLLGHTSWEAAVLGLLAVLVLAVILPLLIRVFRLTNSQQISRMISSSSQGPGPATAGHRSRFLITVAKTGSSSPTVRSGRFSISSW